MFLRKQSASFVSRFVAGLFAVQIVVAGFCVLTTQAHAMPMNQMSTSHMADLMMADQGVACGKSVHMDGQHHGSSHSGGCFHCDEPEQFVKSASADPAPVSLVFVVLSVVPQMPSPAVQDEVTAFLTPTGPPRSSSLLFTTTQRIRV